MNGKNKKELEQIAKQLEEQAANNLTLANRLTNMTPSTKSLTNELACREGVDEVIVGPTGVTYVDDVQVTGPARILIVTD
ncbi:MAG TPA: BC1881 family protein [Limosilactobacillus coleohominis]|nr:BC1881 family protein [Limosilactobacillus coleohominis]